MCEGVDRDSSYGREELHFMHIMNIPCTITLFMWNMIESFVYVIACAF